MTDARREPMTLRSFLQWFAGEMEYTLRANDHKTGWWGMTYPQLLHRLKQETDELERACTRMKGVNSDYLAVIREATDVANFALFIAAKARDEKGIPHE